MNQEARSEILVVDDSPTQAAQLRYILEEHNYKVSVAPNGKEALIRLQNKKPALVISDIVMPEMNGYELCQKIKEHEKFKDISVILLTNLSDAEDIIKGLECGADNFLTKPFDERVLLSQINYMIANKELQESATADLSLNIRFKEKKYFINSIRLQILNLLLSTYETAVDMNNDLRKKENELHRMNKTLEEKVYDRTVELRAEIEERKKIEEELQHRLKMEALISMTSAEFMQKDAQKIDALVKFTLERAGQLEMVDRGYVFLFSEDGKKISNTHEWSTEAIKPHSNKLKNIPVSQLPWWNEKLRQFEIIHIPRVYDLPQEASAEKAILQEQDVQSLVVVPMVFRGTLKGFLGFDSMRKEKEWREADIDLIKILGEIIITAIERAKMENFLREGEERFFTVFNSSPNIMALNKFSDGRYVHINAAFEKITGYAKTEIVGKRANELNLWVEPLDRAQLRKKLLEEKKSLHNYEMKFRIKSGGIRTGLASAELLEIRGERYILNVVTDVTELKRMEQLLVQSEKMASIGTLAAGIAHEINNPVGYMKSNLMTLNKYSIKFKEFINDVQKLIDEHYKNDAENYKSLTKSFSKLKEGNKIDFLLEDAGNAINESIQGTEKIIRIVSDLRDFSRMERAQMKLANINDGIERILNVIWNELKYKAEVIKELGEIPEIECDVHKLDQVFMNLLMNAAQAIEKRGKIIIKTFCNQDVVIVEISDTGVGIPVDHLGKIFDAFFTTKEPGKGTGLGLAIAYRIIHEHKGIIDVESEVGKGTKFTIKLPLQHSQKLKEIKTLIVDDEEGFRISLRDLIISHNPLMNIKTAANGFESADLLNTFRPDIVLLDINMPDIDGFEVMSRIKRDKDMKDTKVVMITGDTNKNIRKRAFDAGVCDFITKPINSEILFAALDKSTAEIIADQDKLK